MSFLASLVAKIIEWLIGKITALISQKVKLIEAEKKDEKIAEDDKKNLENVKNEEEAKRVARDIADHTFN